MSFKAVTLPNKVRSPTSWTYLQQLAENFDPVMIPWAELRGFGVVNRVMKVRRPKPTAGTILAYASQQIVAYRESNGLTVCVFKIGVTANLVCRFLDYKSRNYSSMWVIHQGDNVMETHMLEAALISQFHHITGCRNKAGSGGEGALNRSSAPYFTYVTGGRADQNKRLG